jgi:hypothetical protein
MATPNEPASTFTLSLPALPEAAGSVRYLAGLTPLSWVSIRRNPEEHRAGNIVYSTTAREKDKVNRERMALALMFAPRPSLREQTLPAEE